MIVELITEGERLAEVVERSDGQSVEKKQICGGCTYTVYRLNDKGERQGNSFQVPGHFIRPSAVRFSH